MNVHYYLDKRRKTKTGKYPLRILFTKNGTSAMMTIEIELDKNQWDGNQVVNHPQKKILNTILCTKMAAIQNTILELSAAGTLIGVSAKTAMEIIKETINPELAAKRKMEIQEQEALKHNFSKFFLSYIETKSNQGTKGLYGATYQKLRDFCNNTDIDFSTLTFELITTKFIESFQCFCLTSQSQNSASRHLRDIRAVFNAAIDNNLTTNYPFRKFKIKHVESRDKSLTAGELRALFNSNRYPGGEQEAVDIFKLIFLLIGINPVDLFNAELPHHGRLEYDRKKTGKHYSVRIQPEAADIIEKYKDLERLVNISKRFTNYKTYFNRLAKTLRKVGRIRHDGKKSTGAALLPDVCLGSARTSWATIAQEELDIPREVISAALGHHTVDVTTTYLRTSWKKKVDDANRRVIDWVLYEKK